MGTKTLRSSNFELLRILAMLMIIMHHYVGHGDFVLTSNLTLNKVIIECAYWGGKVGINVFILITGYFMINSRANIRKVMILYGELIFYSILITVIFVAAGIEPLSVKAFVKAIFPFTLGRHNYMTSYIMLYCLSPFLNKLLKSISKSQLNRLLMFLFIILSVIPTVCEIKDGWINNAYSYLFWMIFIYSIGAKIRLYHPCDDRGKYYGSISICSIFVIWILTIVCGQLRFINTWYFVENTYTVPVFVASVCVFLLFKNFNLKSSKVINYFAASTLAVYLIHDDELVRNYVWKEIFRGYSISDTMSLIFNIVFTIIVVFCASVIVDKIRILFIERYYIKIIDTYRIDQKIVCTINRISNKIAG